MEQDEIRDYMAAMDGVNVQIAARGDGSPEIAWGDTFIFARDERGESKKMPFATIVIKDYGDFDCESKLDRGRGAGEQGAQLVCRPLAFCA